MIEVLRYNYHRDRYDCYCVGIDGVIKIEENRARGEGDRWYYDVHFEDRIERVFNPVSIKIRKKDLQSEKENLKVPDKILKQLEAWVNFGEVPDDHVLICLLEGDVKSAALMEVSWKGFNDVVAYIYRNLPLQSYGSSKKVLEWNEKGGIFGESDGWLE